MAKVEAVLEDNVETSLDGSSVDEENHSEKEREQGGFIGSDYDPIESYIEITYIIQIPGRLRRLRASSRSLLLFKSPI